VTGWGSAPALVVVPLLLGGPMVAPARAAGDPSVPARTLFSFADDRVVESSGLVDRGDVVYTTNDSGDDAVLYGVDPRTGRTVSRTTYADSVEDVEDLAPGAGGTVWAGDTGDNRQRRDDIAVYRVTPGEGDSDRPAPRYTLTYPDGPHDAEALLVSPRTRRVLVVSKSAFGGIVYAAPRHLVSGGRPNRLRPFARVSGLVTDGTFLPDGRHVVLRTYGTASVYTFPGFGLVGTVRLPSQPQGEGISVGATGRVLLSSEGVHADVLQATLPAALTAPGARVTRPAEPVPASAGRAPRDTGPARGPWDWLAIAAVGVVIAAAGVLATRARP
jgi:hypothetical protein